MRERQGASDQERRERERTNQPQKALRNGVRVVAHHCCALLRGSLQFLVVRRPPLAAGYCVWLG
jgi:hypothetical protein